MNKIIEFLQSQSQNIDLLGNSISKDKISKAYNSFADSLPQNEVAEKSKFQLKNSVKMSKGQIWLSKNKYYDTFGNKIISNIPYLVLIVSDIEKIAEETFARIQPISPFTEFQAEDDIVITDVEKVGFEFVIETWNEQPILSNLLDEYVCQLENEDHKIIETFLNLSNAQKEFRKTEIRNTGFLRQSVLSLLEFEALKDNKTIFLNIDNSVHYPEQINSEFKSIELFDYQEPNYLLAAKKGKLKDRLTYFYKNTIAGIEIEIIIIKEVNLFILSFKHPQDIELKDENGNVLNQFSPNLYDELTSGLYFICINGIENEIRIRLK